MSKLTKKVQRCGLCHKCGNEEVTTISFTEASAAIELVKLEILIAIEKHKPSPEILNTIKNIE